MVGGYDSRRASFSSEGTWTTTAKGPSLHEDIHLGFERSDLKDFLRIVLRCGGGQVQCILARLLGQTHP